jgi:hypothetical protein
MNGRRLTDAQISSALRAHLPEAAAPGLRERVSDAAETTAQLRSFPSLLGALTEADPIARRRSLLVAVALLLALAVATAAAVGAWRLLQRDPIDELSLEPPADLPAFVLSSYERLPQLPPVALTWHDSDTGKGRIYVDRSGAVRFDRFLSADATEPSSSTILSPNHRISGIAHVESNAVWVEQGHEAIGDDPRLFIRGILNSGGSGPGCEVERDPSEVGNGTTATGWRYVGLEYVAGRPTHHVACVGDLAIDIDLWLDIETRLILRAREPLTDDAGQPIPGQFSTTEVTEIAFGEQPAALFEPPEGVTRMSEEAYGAYLCTAGDLPNEEVVGLGTREGCPTEAEATPQPEPSPTPDLRPSPSDCAIPSRDLTERIGPAAWTQESLKQDWPAPVRPEPAGGAIVRPMPLTYIDPSGDIGSDVLPCIDIRGVMANTTDVHLKLVSNPPPDVDPTEQWIAYGVVTDYDRDGVPDWRYGVDNVPPKPDELATRVWRTSLHSGQTDDHGFANGYFAGVWPSGRDANFRFFGGGETTGGGSFTWGIELDMPFYTWASVIVNGRVVATDYAPDTGWLVATRDAKRGGTYLLEDPVPLSMTVPDGWVVGGRGLSRDAGGPDVEILRGDNPEDPCPDTIEPPLGPSFDDLVTYLAGLSSIDISESTDVTVDGYRGKYLEYTRVDGPVECEQQRNRRDMGEFDGPIPIDLLYNDVWILDVDGVRLVIDAHSDEAPTETVRSEVRQIVASIQIER